jgi:hypothetical protein
MLRSRILALSLFLAAITANGQPLRRHVTPVPRFQPRVTHVFLVILENEDASAAMQQPFLMELASRGATLTNYHGLAHPSLPNYIALAAGSTYGITNDDTITLDVKHLGDLIEERGLTWRVYAENYPGNCFLGDSAGSTSSGQYVRRHVPFINFTNVQNNPQRCADRIIDATALDADIAAGRLPSFAMYIPNDQHNGHDSSVAIADQWLQGRFRSLLADPRFITDTVFIVTFDESNSRSDSTVFIAFNGPPVIAGVTSSHRYDHYSLLRTIEEILRVGNLGKNDAVAEPVSGIWK